MSHLSPPQHQAVQSQDKQDPRLLLATWIELQILGENADAIPNRGGTVSASPIRYSVVARHRARDAHCNRPLRLGRMVLGDSEHPNVEYG